MSKCSGAPLAQFENFSLSFRQFTPPADRLLPLNPRAHYTLDNWTRLWVEDFFSSDVERVLYLDSDIVVVGSLAQLWSTNLDGALFAAVDIPGSDRGVKHLGLSAEDGYFNSGVLLIDLKKWRKTCALEAVLNYVDAYPELIDARRRPRGPERLFSWSKKAPRLQVERHFVVFSRAGLTLPIAPAEIELVRQEGPRIIHFNVNLKQLSYFCDHPSKTEYEKYLRMTEWHDFVPKDQTFVNQLRKRISAILPRKIKNGIKSLCGLISSS